MGEIRIVQRSNTNVFFSTELVFVRDFIISELSKLVGVLCLLQANGWLMSLLSEKFVNRVSELTRIICS